jgi:hypothetical protein
MRKKFAFIVVQKSHEKEASTEAFNVINVMYAASILAK